MRDTLVAWSHRLIALLSLLVPGPERDRWAREWDAEIASADQTVDLMYEAQNIVKPQETRNYIMRMLDIYRSRKGGGIGEHAMKNWPTSY